MAKGMLLSVLRDADGSDCTNGGISSKVKQIIVTGPGIPEIFSPSPTMPEFKLVEKMGGYLTLVPAEQPKGMCGPMAGGNYGWTSDSRMRAICAYPLPIHDRFETAEEADYLSRG